MNAPLTRRVLEGAALRVEWRPLAADIAPQWQKLAERALEPNVFYHPAFALAALTPFGNGVSAGVVWSPSGELLGLFPARVARCSGLFPTLVGWTHPYAPLGTPLIDRDLAGPVLDAWLDHVARDAKSPGQLLMPLVPQEGPFASALTAALARRDSVTATFDGHARALFAPGDARDGYVERAVSTRKRSDLRRYRRRLEQDGAVSLDTVTAPEKIGAAVTDFLTLEAGGWKGRAGTAAAQNETLRAFMQDAVARLADAGQARVDRLMVGERAVAVVITLRSGDAAWAWKIAYDEAYARQSPGVQLMLALTESLLADPNIARGDSCAPADYPMIDQLWRERLPLADQLIGVRQGGLTFALTRRGEAWRRDGIAFAKRLRNRLRA
jgi:CelD/BcsL family acetyltransferase involved in cellulose biosynthesis